MAKQQVTCRAWGEDMLLSDGDNSSANPHSLIHLLVYSGFRMEKGEMKMRVMKCVTWLLGLLEEITHRSTVLRSDKVQEAWDL